MHGGLLDVAIHADKCHLTEVIIRKAGATVAVDPTQATVGSLNTCSGTRVACRQSILHCKNLGNPKLQKNLGLKNLVNPRFFKFQQKLRKTWEIRGCKNLGWEKPGIFEIPGKSQVLVRKPGIS